jgi:hypothetical protein
VKKVNQVKAESGIGFNDITSYKSSRPSSFPTRALISMSLISVSLIRMSPKVDDESYWMSQTNYLMHRAMPRSSSMYLPLPLPSFLYKEDLL